MNSSLTKLTLPEIMRGLVQKEFSAVELAQAYLNRIEAVEPQIHALTWRDAQAALAAAAAADAARASVNASGAPVSEWLGIPVAVKDLISVKSQPCTAASAMLKNYIAPYDATVIARLRAAGAIFSCRTNTDEFAMGGSTESSIYGPTKNPWSLSYVPGGSSGGSAAAVAAGFAPAALASDTGGSIGQPSSFCGVVGLKPTYGRVSRHGGVSYASSLDQIGPIGRTIEDVALLYACIAGQDPYDSTTSSRPVENWYNYSKNLTALPRVKNLRIGLPKEYFVEGVDSEVAAAVRAAVSEFEKLGAHIVEVELPHTEYNIACYYILGPAEASANLARFDGIRYGTRASAEDLLNMYEKTRAEGFGAEVKRRVILGTYVLSSGFYDAYYLRAQKVRTLIRQDFENAFKKCDIIMGPVAPTAAFRLGERTDDLLKMYLGDIFKAVYPLDEFEEKFDAQSLTTMLNYPAIYKEEYVKTAQWIYDRSAQLVAAALAGLTLVLLSHDETIKKVLLTAEGSLFWSKNRNGKDYSEMVQEELHSLLYNFGYENVRVELLQMDNANLIGTAIAALS